MPGVCLIWISLCIWVRGECLEADCLYMDIHKTVTVTSVGTQQNSTEIFVIEEGDVETLSIIVWCLGGVLLVSLLSLLGRIILARNKVPTQLDERSAYSNNVFRIQIPSQPRRPRHIETSSHDTMGLVPGSDVAVTDSPVAQRPQPGDQTARPVSSNAYLQNYCEAASVNAQNNPNSNQNQRQTIVPVYEAIPPQIVTSDAHGRVATVNGYVIRPPSYRDVVAPSCRIPSVIVARPQPRFSL